MTPILPLQSELRPALPTVVGNVDYERFETELKRIDELLRLSQVEALFVKKSLERWLGEGKERVPGAKEQRNYQARSSQALRCTVLQKILGEGYRAMSRRLAECSLFQWFCGLGCLEVVQVPGKSQLQRFADWLPAEEMDSMVERLIEAASATDARSGVNGLWLERQIELDTVWVDGTCVKANIHFPVDWVLLRDAARTLTKATALIRRRGLKGRMQEPGHFLGRMNNLCIEMTHCGGKADSKKARKRVLRSMKKLGETIRKHALRHRDLLDWHWEETDWTRKQAEQVLDRIDQVLLKLPRAVKQAHERIIGERQVKNEEKILSLYEEDLHVLKRGKAGAAVEFGNTLLIAEQAQGLVVDWHLYRESAPADTGQLPGSLERMEARLGKGTIQAVGGDRGFDSAANRELLEEKNIFNGLCPRSVKELERRRRGARFVRTQKRRAQTEGRIGILKNAFLGAPLRSKGYESRRRAVVWSVLAHNLWVLARLERAAEPEAVPRKAA